MTKKDYKLIAGVIKEVALHFVFHEEGTSTEVRDVLTHEFSAALVRDNIKFDMVKFQREVYGK